MNNNTITHFTPSALSRIILLAIAMVGALTVSCSREKSSDNRPLDPWAFRSVLDRKPRILTLALDTSLYAAYDLQSCTLYKVWKGGVLMEGAAYTDKKNIQPTSWGATYALDTTGIRRWVIRQGDKDLVVNAAYKGYRFVDDTILLQYQLLPSSGDTIYIEERPDFVRDRNKRPGLERIFTSRNVPAGTEIAHVLNADTITLKGNGSITYVTYFEEQPMQSPPSDDVSYDHRGRYWMEKSDCMTCHELDRYTVGPGFQEVAAKYPNEKTAVEYLMKKIREGGSGAWGTTPMNAHPGLSERELRDMVNYILSLKPTTTTTFRTASGNRREVTERERKPGFGASLVGVHPSYDLLTLHNDNFKPRVGGLAFLPDGRLLVTTWDIVGGVYLVDGVETGDTAKIAVKRIASGLAEPLGIEVVDGEIYVLQKHELTRLKDMDGDEVIDVYEVVCDAWDVTDDFHEFAFGLLYKDGDFYATLSLAMRLMSHERQKFDRGRTIRIRKDGTYDWVNFGLRTPNGIGLGVDNEIFVTDNQGEWTPANKLIHVKPGEFLGMYWGLPPGLVDSPPPIAPPAVWLPQDEIGNSPSEPVLIHHGLYKGQMLHGDVTHGGIKRDFLEKVNGEYQGCVFRFTQGLEAGVNRLRWGPDSALYIGGVGMVGGWSWKEKQYGLQKLTFNGKTAFEMLRVNAKPDGFAVTLTEALDDNTRIVPDDIIVQQWRYEGTAAYGGPKLDLVRLPITGVVISADRKQIDLRVDGLKERHVVYIVIPEDLRSASGQSLWSNETWYTLNNIPNNIY